MQRKLLILFLVGIITLGIASASGAAMGIRTVNNSADPWTTWAKDHTIQVLVIEKIRYQNGVLTRHVEYSGDELKVKFGVNRLFKVEKW
ncbi:MAG: hypothetical protein PWQ79_847 [Thermococcaceae archaeon]|nr:hypothetical protein [Thermococcaceae archaeon]